MVEGYQNQDITPRELYCIICTGLMESSSRIFPEGIETIVQGINQDSSDGGTEWSREDNSRQDSIII